MSKLHTCTYTYFSFTAGTFIPHTSSSLQTEDGACVHPIAPFAKYDVCTSALYLGGNWFRRTGKIVRSQRWERRRKRGRGYDRGRKRWRRRGRIENGNGNRGGNPRTNTKMGTAMGAGTEPREVVETRTVTEEGGGEMKKRKKPLRGCRRQARNGGNIGEKVKQV